MLVAKTHTLIQDEDTVPYNEPVDAAY